MKTVKTIINRLPIIIDQLIETSKASILYTESDYKGHFVLHDSHNAPHSDALEKSEKEYI